jgi:Secretion system C-terminal sorting domain
MDKFLFIYTFLTMNLFAQIQNIRVSKLSSINPEEVTIAINPINPNQMAAGANINYFYSSNDSGRTWSEKNMSSLLGVWGDPCVLYNNSGDLFFAHLSYPNNGHWIDRIVVQKSLNNGFTWTDGIGIGYRMAPIVQDKEWLAVDNSNSVFRDNIYLAWTEFDEYGSSSIEDSSRIRFSRSTDGGSIWSEPIKISDKGGNCVDDDLTVEGAVPTVGPNGEVYISWSGPEGIVFDKSLDGGESFGNDVFVTDLPGGWAFDIPGISRCNGFPITSCDISQSPYWGNIYINWSDQRMGTNNTDIFFIKSEDGGETWADIITVNNDNTERHQFFSWMSVDPLTGFIYIVFYDRRNTVGVETEVYLAKSDDGGDTFENFKISESSFFPNSTIFFGDYTNIAAYDGIIRPIWMRMDDSKLSVWTALINDSELTNVESEQNLDISFSLFQNYPNPFNPTTIISYRIPKQMYVEIEVFDILGRQIRLLEQGIVASGVHEIEFDATESNSGIYFYKITAGNFVQSKKMILIK